jgi:hypothetical protein
MCRDDDPVADRHHGDGRTDLVDDTERLVTEHQPRLGAGAPVEHVQISSADRAGGDPDDDIGWSSIAASGTS